MANETSPHVGSADASRRSEDPCAVLDKRCWEFDDLFWKIELHFGYDTALRMACSNFGIKPEQGEAILACHDEMQNGNC
jgi:hypothetical protein